jgi:lysophospholipase L1-like esterase
MPVAVEREEEHLSGADVRTRFGRVTGRLARLGFGTVLVIVVLGGAELGLRAVGLGEGAPGYDPFAGFSTAVPLLVPDEAPGAEGWMRVSRARLGAAEADRALDPQRRFLAQKPPGTFRIFVAGGSTAAGMPYSPDASFSGWLERRLHAALPDIPVEVVNIGISGYGSRRVELALREASAWEPDLFIVYTGHNEWAEPLFYADLTSMDPRLFALAEWLTSTRLFRALSSLRTREKPGAEELVRRFQRRETTLYKEFFAVWRSRTSGKARVSADEIAARDAWYRANLERMADVAEASDAALVFVIPAQNLADWAPGASAHRPDLSAEAHDEWDRLVDTGRAARDASDCGAALVTWSRALALDDAHAGLHWLVAGCERSLGRSDDARRHYQLASDLDQVPHGAPSHFGDALRAAAADCGAIVVDAGAAMERAAADGLPGDALFVDFAHPNLVGYQIVAAALADGLRANDLPAPAARWRDGVWSDPAPATVYAAHPEYREREVEARYFACLLARRPVCLERARLRIMALDPDHPLARIKPHADLETATE